MGCSNQQLLIASNTALIVDWSQTRYIIKHDYHEHNPILGSYPSQGDVNTYFATAIILNTALYWILPEKIKPYWYGGLTALEVAVITNNATIGVGLD
jgi:hypothetical protein